MIPRPVIAAGLSIGIPQLNAVVQKGSQVSLHWEMILNNTRLRISGYEIERSLKPDSGFSVVMLVSRNYTSVIDQNVQAGQVYYYRVRAYKTSKKNNDYSEYSNVVFTEILAQKTVDDTPPTITLITPQDNTVLSSEQTIDINVSAVDDTGVDRVEFFSNNVKIGSSNSPPYNIGWTVHAALNGQQNLNAKAYDKSGNEAISSTKTVFVDIQTGDALSPTVAINKPANGSVYESAQTISIVASAQDNVGVSKVEFYDGNVLKATDTSSPYIYDWSFNEVNNGLHSFTAKAYDAANNVQGTYPVSVTVDISMSATEFPAPTLEYVQESNGDFVLGWIQPVSSYGSPEGGFDIYVDDMDTGSSNRSIQQTTIISGLAAGEHCFNVEGRWTQVNPPVFPLSNRVCAIIEGSVPVSPPGVSGPLKVFPGAEGFGTDTPAGRGGQIIKVTNLNDSGSGSLRAAINADGPRIIVFEVGGLIDLLSTIEIRNPYLTIAGQTAPSPGITLRGKTLQIATHDVLVQHMRMRVGDIRADGTSIDGITIRGSSVYNIVVDHVSSSWGLDENLGTWDAQHDVTISNSIFSEALVSPSYGMLIGDYSKNITIVKNLMAHNAARNPLLKGGTSTVVVNNVMYNSTGTFMQTTDDANAGPCYVSAVGNVFIDGPNTPADVRGIKASGATPTGSLFYMDDNLRIGNGPLFSYSTSFDPRVSTPPVWADGIDIYPGANTQSLVLQNVGARPNDQDEVDERIISEVLARGGGQISSQDEVGGWPVQQSTYRAFIVPSNPSGDDDGDGYTNIEEIIHAM